MGDITREGGDMLTRDRQGGYWEYDYDADQWRYHQGEGNAVKFQASSVFLSEDQRRLSGSDKWFTLIESKQGDVTLIRRIERLDLLELLAGRKVTDEEVRDLLLGLFSRLHREAEERETANCGCGCASDRKTQADQDGE